MVDCAAMTKALVLCVGLLSAQALAEGCPVPPGGSPQLGAEAPAQRFGYVQSWLKRDAHRARIWNFTWIGVNAALAVGQGVAAPFFKMPDRVDWVVGAISAGVSALSYVFFAIDVPDPLPADAAPDCSQLLEAERRMKVGRDSEAFGVSLWSHVLAVGLAVVPALVLGLGYKRWESAGLLFLGGVVVDEAAVLTTPTGLRDAYDAYLKGEPSRRPVALRETSFGLAPLLRDGRADGWVFAVSGAF